MPPRPFINFVAAKLGAADGAAAKPGDGAGHGGFDVFDFYSSLFESDGPSASSIGGEKKRGRDEEEEGCSSSGIQDVEKGGIAAILARAQADPLDLAKRAKLPPRQLSTGHQLLKNLGWKDGMGLGSSQQGILEPVGAFIKNDKKGVGKGRPEPKQAPRSLLSATTFGKHEAERGGGNKKLYGNLPQGKKAAMEKALRDKKLQETLHQELNFSSYHAL